MKRIALLTVLLLVVGLAAFAIDVKPTYTLTGSASVTFGYDLDTGYTGFHNTADASFTLNLLAADGTDTHAGTGAAYGSITISNIEFYWTDDSNNHSATPVGGTQGVLDAGYGPDPADGASVDVTAKIVVTPFEIGVYAAPGYTQDFFGAFEDADVPDLVVDANETAFAMLGAGFTHTLYGSWVTATFGPAVVTAKIASNGDWTTNSSNQYAEGVEATLTFTPVVINAGGYFGLIGMSFYGKGTFTMTDSVTLWAAAEYNMPNVGTSTLGVGGGATLTLAKDTTLAATAWYGDVYNGLDLSVVFTEPGDAGIIPMLDTTITFNLLDVLDQGVGALTPEYEIVTATGYKIGLNSDNSQYARPFINVTYGSATNNGVTNFTAIPVLNATVGVQLQIIPLTLFTAEWVSGAALGADLASNPMVKGSIQLIAAITY